MDAHELIALCAPRLTFISYGVPEKGDAKWLDQQGSYMATVAARSGLPPAGREGSWREGGLSHGEDAAREHGIARRAARLAAARRRATPTLRTGSTSSPGPTSSCIMHRLPQTCAIVAGRSAGLSRRSELHGRARATAREGEGRAASTSTSKAIPSRDAGARLTIQNCWRTGRQNFFGWNAADFGWGADRTQNILWRLENGELDGVNPKVVVLLAGTNNVSDRAAPGSDEEKAAT